MFVLLQELRRIRRTAALQAPEFRGSMALRHVDAGSCNGCEHELNQLGTPFYDFARFGLSVVASPRHADALIVTGSVTRRMLEPLRAAYEAMPVPRIVVAVGDCAARGDTLADPAEVVGPLSAVLPVDLEIRGCPPDPDRILEALVRTMAAHRR